MPDVTRPVASLSQLETEPLKGDSHKRLFTSRSANRFCDATQRPPVRAAFGFYRFYLLAQGGRPVTLRWPL